MPTTPLRTDSDDFSALLPADGDTERPPAVSHGADHDPPGAGNAAFSPEPTSGVADVGTPPSFPRPNTQPIIERPRGGSSGRLRVAAAAHPAVAPNAHRQATMLHAGAPPVVEELPLSRRCGACGTLYPADFLVCPRDASPLVDETPNADGDPLLGRLLGESYQIVRVIGEGGMGRVYEARHLRLKERRFAVKVLHADLAKNTEIVARFLREAESASSLSHPNVVDVFDVHHLADGTPYLVAELLDGEELADYVARIGPLEPRIAAVMFRQVCRALGAAHARGIVHRDMKPENVFVLRSSFEALAAGETRQITVKVLDFGISKSKGSEDANLTRTGVIMGTPSYMSPEQARGKPVDLRADVYSTGAALYYALTGRRPFDSTDPTSTLSMVLTQEPTRPRLIDPRIPEALELVVQRAMAKEPNDRYEDMNALDRALAAFDDSGAMVVHGVRNASTTSERSSALRADAGAASQAIDLAKNLFGSQSGQASGALAKIARPTIVVSSTVLGLWLVGGTAAALAGLVRVLHDGEVTLTESVLLVVGCLFAAATPIALYVLHVKKVIWPNSVRALQLASDLKRTATAALITYGALSIVARIAHTVLWRSSRGLASGVWDLVLFAVSVLAALTMGGAGLIVRNMRRRR